MRTNLGFVRYAAGVATRPRATFRVLLAAPDRVLIGLGGLLALSAAYGAVISLGLARNPDWTPDPRRLVLRLPPERYYVWERVFILPVALAETILTAGVARLLAQAWGGQGRFEDLFALLGLSHTTLVVSMAAPDAVATFLPRRRTVPLYVYAGTLWMAALLVLAIHEAERLTWAKSVAVAVPAAMANAAVEYVFIR